MQFFLNHLQKNMQNCISYAPLPLIFQNVVTKNEDILIHTTTVQLWNSENLTLIKNFKSNVHSAVLSVAQMSSIAFLFLV